MLRKALGFLDDLLAEFRRLRPRLGSRGALEYVCGYEFYRQLSKGGASAKGRLIRFHVAGYPHALLGRYETSDRENFEQVFVQRQYDCLDALREPVLIVDCGAYVGYASVYYLNKYPRAMLIAIEPSRDNFLVCQQNLAPYRRRVRLIHGGVWSHPTGLRVVRGRYRDGREWATQVRECGEGELPEVQAVSLDHVLKESGAGAIDLLKIDIEGSEKVLFGDRSETWLPRVRNISVELHDEECEAVFLRALQDYRYELSRSGEVTVASGLTWLTGQTRMPRATPSTLIGGDKANGDDDMSPTVSVVVPTYNRAAWLQEAIDSVRAQTFQAWELIIVDDGSTDDTSEVVQRYVRLDERIRYVRQDDRGGASALNRGIGCARGELVAFLDSDDRWLPDKLERQVGYLAQHPGHAGVFCFARMIDAQNRLLGQVMPRREIEPLISDLLAWRGTWVPSLTMVRRETLLRVGGFDTRFKVGYDRDLWVRILAHEPIGKLDDVLAEYRVHPTNLSKNVGQIVEDRIILLAKLRQQPNPGISRRWLSEQVGLCHYQLAWDHTHRGQFNAAAAHLLGAVNALPTIGLHVKRRQRRSAAYRFLSPYLGIGYCGLRAVAERATARVRGGADGEGMEPTPAVHERADRPRRVLVAFHRCEQTGAAQSMREVLERLNGSRYHIVVASPGIGPTEERLRGAEIDVRELPAISLGALARWWRYPSAVRRLCQLIRSTRAELVDVNYHSLAPVAVTAARLAGVPVNVHVRVIPWLSWFEQWALSRANAVVCVSETVRQAVLRPRHLARWLPLDPTRCGVVPSGRDLRPFQQADGSAVRRELGVSPNGWLIGIAGSLEPNKRQDLFLRVAADVAAQEPRAKFLIVGEPHMAKHRSFKDQLITLSRRLGLEGRVTFAGWRRDMPQVMRALDLYCLLSKRDACPGVLIEAMAAGVPVVTSAAGGGASELIGEAGWALDSNDPVVYARAIVKLLRDPARRSELAQAGCRRAQERYPIARTIDGFQGVYEAILQGRTDVASIARPVDDRPAPTVSVLIPTYNRSARVSRALESVAAQTYRDFEVIVIDDGSTDNTREVVLSFKSRLPSLAYLYKPNGGQASALNAGLRAARGRYLAFLDDDDTWMPEKLARQVPLLEQNPSVGLAYTAVVCTKGGAILRRQPERPGLTLREMVERGCFIHCSAVLVRRACLDRVGMFDETMARVKDFDLWMRIARHDRLAYLDDVLATYAQHDGNMTRDFLGGVLGHLTAIQHVKPLPEAGVTRRLLRQRRADLHYHAGRLAWDAQRYLLAARHFGLAVWEWPLIGARVRAAEAPLRVRAIGALKPAAGIAICLARWAVLQLRQGIRRRAVQEAA